LVNACAYKNGNEKDKHYLAGLVQICEGCESAVAKLNQQLSLLEKEILMNRLKRYFETSLEQMLNLTKVSTPLFVNAESGINDHLNGVEEPVSFISRSMSNTKHAILNYHPKKEKMRLLRNMELCLSLRLEECCHQA
jgi:hypothetical protein